MLLTHRANKKHNAVHNENRLSSKVIEEARQNAAMHQKFLMVEFGAEWCSDCLELARQLETGPARKFTKERIELLSVDVGEFNRNIDVAGSISVDVTAGIPVVALFAPSDSTPTIRRGTDQVLALLGDLAQEP